MRDEKGVQDEDEGTPDLFKLSECALDVVFDITSNGHVRDLVYELCDAL